MCPQSHSRGQFVLDTAESNHSSHGFKKIIAETVRDFLAVLSIDRQPENRSFSGIVNLPCVQTVIGAVSTFSDNHVRRIQPDSAPFFQRQPNAIRHRRVLEIFINQSKKSPSR